MIVSEIIGGLGNQLFQYAAARHIAQLLHQEISLDLTFFDQYHNPDVFRLDKYNVQYGIADDETIRRLKRVPARGLPVKVLRKLLKRPIYLNSRNHFDNFWFRDNDWHKLQGKKDIYISGYFSNPLFFKDIEGQLKKEFTLKVLLNEENKKMKEKITSVNSVCIHIRRGDYVNNNYFVSQPISYYERGIARIKEKVDDPVFFIFSDDLNWTKDNLKFDDEKHFVDINDGKTDYMELDLIASCKHDIIANSTFSWWGAWLNNNPDKIVIVPEQWYTQPEKQAIYLKQKVYQEGWYRL